MSYQRIYILNIFRLEYLLTQTEPFLFIFTFFYQQLSILMSFILFDQIVLQACGSFSFGFVVTVYMSSHSIFWCWRLKSIQMKYLTFIKFHVFHTLLQPGYLHCKGASNLWDRICSDICSPFFRFLLHMGHWKKRMWKNITKRLKGLPCYFFSFYFLFPSLQCLLL